MYYLGTHGSEASRREYDRIIAEFLANGRQSCYDTNEILIESLIIRFLTYAEKEVNYSESARKRLTRALCPLRGVLMFTPPLWSLEAELST